MARHKITDQQWDLIKHLFPEAASTGRPPSNPRTMLDGIMWRLRTGSPWRDIPQEFGPWETVYKYFDTWNSDGTLDKVKQALLSEIVDSGQVDQELWCVDGTVVRAARCAGGGGKKVNRMSQLTTH
jgi:transposase